MILVVPRLIHLCSTDKYPSFNWGFIEQLINEINFKNYRKDMTSSYKSTLTGYGYFIIAFFSLICGPILGQLNLTFDHLTPLSGSWEGDVQHFKINDNGMLQLQSPIAGTSKIFTKYRIPADSLDISLYFRMDFAPSNENMSKIWLMTNTLSENTASGYYLKLGENGSQDAIQWWRAEQGEHRMLASGRMGGIGNEPAIARIRATWHASGLCVMATDYDGYTFFEEDALFSELNFMKADSVWFGIQCKYSSSRKDKFFFDDIYILPLARDTSPPLVLHVKTAGDHEIIVEYNEVPTMESAGNTTSYQIFPHHGHPDEVVFPCDAPNRACLKSKSPLVSGLSGLLQVTGIKDDAGNHINQQIPFIHATKPMPGDLVITEILTNPFVGGEDFLELYNVSDKLIWLDSLVFENTEKQERKMIRSSAFLEPGKYMAISSDTLSLKNLYAPPDTARFMQALLPSLNIESAIIKMYNSIHGQKNILDSVRYHEDMHHSLLVESKGVSLEKIQSSGLSWDAHNWHSASSVTGYGTPGYKNSVSISETTVENCDFCIYPDKKIFSPDGDGFDDYLAIHYRMKKPGCMASISLFDGEGYAAGAVSGTLLLGSEGLVLWDGDSGDGRIISSGIYILIFRWFHSDGEMGVSRHPVVVAKRN